MSLWVLFFVFVVVAWDCCFWTWRLTRAPGVLLLVCAEYSAVMCGGLSKNLNDLTVVSSQYDLLQCSETLVSDRRHMSELLVPGFGRPVLLCRYEMPRARGMAAYVREGYGTFRQHKYECGCCEMLVFIVCGTRQNFYVFSLYRNPDLDDQIYDCFLTSMAVVQAEDVRALFLFMGDLNGHHQEWLAGDRPNSYS